MALYQTSPIKRHRRTNDDLANLLKGIQETLAEYEEGITIRHLFYRLVGKKLIEKTEAEYAKLCSHLSKWRRSGDIPWTAFIDGTRFYYGSDRYDDMDDALRRTAVFYRKDLWKEQPHFLEVWVEKDAISGMVSEIADAWGVRTFTCRGFPSLSSLHVASETFKHAIRRGKEVTILYFGDHDPSGVAIDTSITDAFRDDFSVVVGFKRLAVRPEHIVALDLPTRPVKAGDTRGKDWQGGCVEVDTLTPVQLRDLLEREILERIETDAWKRMQQIEQAEKQTLENISQQYRNILN